MLYQDLPDNLYIAGSLKGGVFTFDQDYHIEDDTRWLPVWSSKKDCKEFNKDNKLISKIERSHISQLIYTINDQKKYPVTFLYIYFNPSRENIDSNETITNSHDYNVIHLKSNFGYLLDVIAKMEKDIFRITKGIKETTKGIEDNTKVIDLISENMEEMTENMEEMTKSTEEMTKRVTDLGNGTILNKNHNRYIPKEVRKEVWDRDVGRCTECGSSDHIEYDHIVPVSKGGSNTAPNIELLCRSCNRKKSNKDPGYH